MAAPLIAQKTDSNVARLVESQVKYTAKPGQPQERKPTKTLLLLNLVGKGEVDEDLKDETAEEAAKYGKVLECRVMEVPNAADDSAVRIFLHFDALSSSIKAKNELNGR